MSPSQKPGSKYPYYDTRQAAKIPVTAAEDITKRLEEKRKAVAERNRQAELERNTAEDELATAQIRERTLEIEKRQGDPPSLDPLAKGEESRIWQVDEEKLRLRPARTGEPPLTFAEATEVLREMKKGEDVPIIIFNPETSQHIPNPMSDFAKKNPTIAWATAKEYDKQLTTGKEPDAVEIFLDQKKKWSDLMGAAGIKDSGGSELAILDRLEKLGLIVKPEQAGGAMTALLTQISEKLDSRDKTNPDVDALKTELKALNDQLAKDREDRLRGEIAALKAENRTMGDRIEQVARERTADTELGLMGKIVDRANDGANGMRDIVFKFLGPRPPGTVVDGAGQRALATGQIAEEATLVKERSALVGKIFFKQPGT